MAIASMKVALMHSADGTTYAKVSSGSEELCIKEVPDLDISGNPDQIETTTLCDELHTYIDGLKTLPETLEFTANYSPALFSALQNLADESYWAVWFGCDSNGDPDGHNGKVSFTAKCDIRISGFGVGEVVEMVVILKPTSTYTFAVS